MNRAVLLDRDGVINEDRHYLYRPEEFCFMDHIFKFCRAAQQKAYLLIVVTNQSGVARGYYTEDAFLSLNQWMCKQFKEQGILIDKVYYCPYHPEKGVGRYKMDSYDRKPNPGMILKAKEEFNLDLKNSILIGDKDSDMHAGRRAGVGRLLLLSSTYKDQAADDVTVIRSLSEAEQFL